MRGATSSSRDAKGASKKLAHQNYASNYNDRAHPRNRYGRGHEADFADLASRHEGFANCTEVDSRGERRVNWQHPDTAYALTRALLDEDFGLKWTLPASDSNLRPPIPRSLNYLHWVEDLLLLAGIRLDTELRGIDIGTGASCIFPLLCCAMHPQWSFLATDTMSASVEAAVANVTANELNSRISVLHTRPSDLIGGAIAKDSAFWHSAQARNTSGRYAFVLCNPPFFAGNEHAALLKSSEESSFAGTSNELFFAPRVAPSACSHSGNNSTSVDYSRTAKECKEVEQFSSGGEVDFVRMLIDDSVASSVSSNAVVWFTSMLGRKSSLAPVLAHLRTKAPKAVVRSTTLYQGKTLRWAVAWSFLPTLAVFPSPSYQQLAGKKRMRQDDDVSFLCSSQATLADLRQRITQVAEQFADAREQVSTVQVEHNPESTDGVTWLLLRILGQKSNPPSSHATPLALCTFTARYAGAERAHGGQSARKKVVVARGESESAGQETVTNPPIQCTLQWVGGTQRSMFQRLGHVIQREVA